MSAQHAADENPISQIIRSTRERLHGTLQYFCLFAILSTYLFVILKPSFIQNNKALGGK
ncbi:MULTISPECIES: hypothetical protein [Shewanella]|uniref:hypothetical protein n=1 Tax=Shewanella TaxID=22 RepID=UPI00142E4054|nr:MULTISPECIES: hypothetical protein [Shewanella]QYJ71387.1 hypothetical protein K0H59_20670 [Shewanella sp. FJAT-51649]